MNLHARRFFLLHCIVFVQLLPTNSLALVDFSGPNPIVIDSLIDDDVRITTLGPVSILPGARITGNLQIQLTGEFLMSGGIIEGYLLGGYFGDTVMRISGGEIRSGVTTADLTVIDIRGGLISGPFLAIDATKIIFHGSSFNFPLGPIGDSSGQLTGTLADGSPLSGEFQRNNGPFSSSNIILVPEPSSILLFCLAIGVLLLTHTKRNAAIA